MHSLPGRGGEDGVCLALTQLSKGFAEDNTSGLQAGGCDSSDCLFCQYRSNSPSHLNAYAGKLTSLLRKRSLNGMTLASLNSLVDTTTEHGAALLTAAAAAMCNGGKRHKATSSNGILATAAASSGPHGPTPSPLAAADSAPTVTSTAAAAASHLHHPHAPPGAPHDCRLMCGGRLCSEHAISRPAAEAAAPALEATAAAALARPVGAVTPDSTLPSVASSPTAQLEDRAGGSGYVGRPSTVFHATAVGAVYATAGTDAETARAWDDTDVEGQPHPRPSPQDPEHPDADAAGPGPSSLQLLQFLQASKRRQQARQQQQQHHHNHRHDDLHHSHHGTCWPGEGQQPAAGPQQRQQQRRPQAQQPRLVGGRPLPEGWAFRSEWRDRSDPAPAELQEVLQLPDVASFSRGGRRSSPSSSLHRGGGTGGLCRGSAGIVCALEFSPDGRLLAAGGVDKQIRLYNLSSAFGDLADEDREASDGIEADDDDDILAMGLGADSRCGDGDPGPCGAPARRVRRSRDLCDGDDSDDDDDERDVPLLAAVQRMPSKVSSLAWSPFLDGVLTVGDYDGVLLQLHIASGHQLADVEAHGGRKIWSVAHSPLTPHLAASAADDRCARLWAGRGLAHCVASVQPNPRAAVCSVDFSPTYEHLLAVACSDRTAYLYDTRSLGRGPLAALRHHARPASYCRFLGGDRLVTAATDASLALWDISDAAPTLAGVILPTQAPPMPAVLAGAESSILSPRATVQKYGAEPAGAAAATGVGTVTTAAPCGAGSGAGSGTPGVGGLARPCRVFRGHRNEKNFVGLSVRAADGLLACGSECSRAFVYNTSWSDPLATVDLPWSAAADTSCATGALHAGGAGPYRGGDAGAGSDDGFVSAVCWQPAEAAAVLGLPPLLASATSLGVVNVSVLAARH